MGLGLPYPQTLLRSLSLRPKQAATDFTVLGQACLVRFWTTIWRPPLVSIDQGGSSLQTFIQPAHLVRQVLKLVT